MVDRHVVFISPESKTYEICFNFQASIPCLLSKSSWSPHNSNSTSQPRSAEPFSTSNSHVVEEWPDIEMNSAQAAFLDFVRPRCWTLAWSWNELSSGSFFRLRTATLLNPDLILKWTQLRQLFYTSYGHDLEMNSAQAAFLEFVRPRCWTLAWSWNELGSGSLFRLCTATLLNPGLILKWTQLRQLF